MVNRINKEASCSRPATNSGERRDLWRREKLFVDNAGTNGIIVFITHVSIGFLDIHILIHLIFCYVQQKINVSYMYSLNKQININGNN